jgi:hypothetical protein
MYNPRRLAGDVHGKESLGTARVRARCARVARSRAALVSYRPRAGSGPLRARCALASGIGES